MIRYERIAVGLDSEPDGKSLTRRSRRAMQQASDVARRTGASVAFLHSTFLESDEIAPEYWTPESHTLPPASWQVLKAASHPYTDEKVETSLHFTNDPTWIELTRWAQEGKADLIVVGKRNQTEGNRKIGTGATKLLRRCPVPVWVVHPDHEPGDGCVLAATDLSEVGARATEIALCVAELYKTDLHILHAYQNPMSLILESSKKNHRSRLRAVRAEI